MVEMSDPAVEERIVRDIGPAQGKAPWRWAGKRPTLKVLVVDTKGLKFVTDFALWDEAMKQTGPVTISFFIGDQLLDKITYDTPGSKHFEKLVDPDWLQTINDTEFGAEIDKVYTAPLDGAKFGFIVSRMGLVRQ